MFYVVTLENREMYHYYTVDTVEEVMKMIDDCIVNTQDDCEVLDAFGFIYTERETHNKPMTILITGPFTKEMTTAIQMKIKS